MWGGTSFNVSHITTEFGLAKEKEFFLYFHVFHGEKEFLWQKLLQYSLPC
jgi:hypothetical protein